MDILNEFEALQKQQEMQTTFFQKFKQMHGGNSSRRDNRGTSTNVSPVGRRSLIDRQREYKSLGKSRASMSPDQLRKAELMDSKNSIGYG